MEGFAETVTYTKGNIQPVIVSYTAFIAFLILPFRLNII